MSTQAISLIEKALSPDEAQQLEFASKIDLVVKSFPPKFVQQELFPFLATWVPRNNKIIVSTLCSNVDKLASVQGAFISLAPVVESFLSSENQENAKIVRDKLLSIGKVQSIDANGFLKRLAQSPLDFVRSFVPSIISLLSSDEDKKAIYSILAYDVSFKVRTAVCISIPKLSIDLAKQVAISLLKDNHSRIKALLPVVCSKTSFFFEVIAPTLVEDHDWSVRASVAKELVNAKDSKEALRFCCLLIEDSVWQVILCALKSLTIILKRTNGELQTHDFLAKILETFMRILPYQQLSLKNAVIDAFIAIFQSTNLENDKVSLFVSNVITRQPQTAKLHFIDAVTSANLKQVIVMMRDNLYNLVVSLLSSDQWRIRLGIINAINAIASLNGEQELKKSFSDLCFQTLDDKATPVRIAAAEEFTKFFIEAKSDKLYPDCFVQLKMSDSFRKRQSALTLLKDIAKFSTKENKAKIVEEMKYFENDACENVVNLAKDLISQIQ